MVLAASHRWQRLTSILLAVAILLAAIPTAANSATADRQPHSRPLRLTATLSHTAAVVAKDPGNKPQTGLLLAVLHHAAVTLATASATRIASIPGPAIPVNTPLKSNGIRAPPALLHTA